MKHLLRLSFIAFAINLLAISLHAQSVDGVITSLKTGNAAQLVGNVGENMQLTIADKSNNYNKSQAEQALKEFFGKVTVKGFELKHKGSSPNGNYAIGTLQTAGGNYRVNIFMRKEKGGEVIKELRFQLIE
ncbi:DUF4783 domain-containing protein [Niabella drilacis]|uniref:DUF4783 domain-containing protein n=1 Tax=Niabella drilacis (strain DSM 25811 / CCM 8410 / CCUG 62505 / LMG 26954 / E90) TaxID=1285928 RepID=A0A1G6Z3V9_NIADE|nr:DUF4783 domain-containing protein [Niabella drilacis]SDD97349.1 protein of unknown function [Niabella drilacis]